MDKHKINLGELLQWKSEQEFLYASSSPEGKRLYITSYGGFLLKKNGKKVFETDQAHVAVSKYNEL